MGTFLAEWGLAILISLAVLAVLIWAEWRDHRDGLYDDDGAGEGPTLPGADSRDHPVHLLSTHHQMAHHLNLARRLPLLRPPRRLHHRPRPRRQTHLRTPP